MWYLKNDGTFAKTTDPELIQVESLFQELQLWKGENPMNAELGIDYIGVFENRVFLKNSISDICEKYADSFKDIVVGDISYENNDEVAFVPITITMQDDSQIVRKLQIMI